MYGRINDGGRCDEWGFGPWVSAISRLGGLRGLQLEGPILRKLPIFYPASTSPWFVWIPNRVVRGRDAGQ